jgi:hypothetical protein
MDSSPIMVCSCVTASTACAHPLLPPPRCRNVRRKPCSSISSPKRRGEAMLVADAGDQGALG